MKTFTMTLKDAPQLEPMAVAIGFFDGLHLGHRELIAATAVNGLKRAVLTFSEDMKASLEHRPMALLLTESEKQARLADLGIDYDLKLTFTDDVRNASVEQFLGFLRKLNAKTIVVGEDFSFARYGQGKAKDLLCLEEDGIDVRIISLLKTDRGKISTTAIRQLLAQGDIETASRYLGYDFYYTGVVEHGLENGRRIGYPTANMPVEKDKFILPDGVYRTVTEIDGILYKSMTNIGNHPTVNPIDHSIVETYVIGYQGNLYGRTLKVSFREFLRPQRKFDSLDDLRKQLEEDCRRCDK